MAEFPKAHTNTPEFPVPPGNMRRVTDHVHNDWGVAGLLAVMVTVMVGFATLTPYVVVIPESNLTLITQAQTTLWNGWLVILGYYFATNQLQGRKDAAIQSLAKANETAQNTLSALPAVGPTASADMLLKPGETATATATQAGTTIEKGDAP